MGTAINTGNFKREFLIANRNKRRLNKKIHNAYSKNNEIDIAPKYLAIYFSIVVFLVLIVLWEFSNS